MMAEMTPQEAIEILQEERDWAQQPFYVDAAISIAIEAIKKQFQEQEKTLTLAFGKDGKARVLNEDYVIYCADKETFEKVKEAVEKTMPKKPVDTDWLYCPNCNWKIALCVGDEVCPKCGQALDWSDVE